MKHTIAIICAGPGPERGVSLNSARSLYNHLDSKRFEVITFFVDLKTRFYLIPNAHLLSNTPEDFDFKIDSIGRLHNLEELAQVLKTCTLVFPTVHGLFGEDGQLSAILENMDVAFVGNSAKCCSQLYAKHKAQAYLQKNNFSTLPFLSFDSNTVSKEHIEQFWQQHIIDKAILKPSCGGSSLGVTTVHSLEHCLLETEALCTRYGQLILQPYHQGSELTLIVLETQTGPVALLPTETHKGQNEILDYRSKYLPTNQCTHTTPARYSNSTLSRIQKSAEKLFRELKLRDCARFDGWWCETQGFICNDINLISGLEENSFFFKQSALCGLNHTQTLNLLLRNAYHRYQLTFPPAHDTRADKQIVYVLFGGNSAERQVSLMSGRNVWLKLTHSQHFQPIPVYLDSKERIWQLPAHLFLHHTTEEIDASIHCLTQTPNDHSALIHTLQTRLGMHDSTTTHLGFCNATLNDWIASLSSSKSPCVFIALHGGIGENGELQRRLNKHHIRFQGSDAHTSNLCMDKAKTQQHLQNSAIPMLAPCVQYMLEHHILRSLTESTSNTLWQHLCTTLSEKRLLIKPRSDGCSAGIAQLHSAKDLLTYAQLIASKVERIPANIFPQQSTPIEMPNASQCFIVEAFILTDSLIVDKSQLQHHTTTYWLELTGVVIEQQQVFHAFNPSITVKNDGILSVEEKFQGGTGCNLTPPPTTLISKKQLKDIKSTLCLIAKHLNIRHYARVDFFYHTKTQKLRVIEVNTLPALTPSTVLFQQALAETPAQTGLAFLEELITKSITDYVTTTETAFDHHSE